MDEIIMRRLRHLQWLEENHAKTHQARESAKLTQAENQRENVSNVLSADWNRNRRKLARGICSKKLPPGWRKEHWKTQQSMARDYAGVDAACKEEAIKALEAYETDGSLPPAA